MVEGNLLWALAGVAALATGLLSPTTAGLVWIPLQAAVVAAFAAGQHLALRAATRPAG
ncbi:hypothetical protein [Streptomyces glaucosporus]|uniref:hypothetical protein n=1 Tax=Streptomyces glaucosporus TaxID=284044 RepID=UPI003CD06E65